MKHFLNFGKFLGRKRTGARYRYAQGAPSSGNSGSLAAPPPPTVLSLINNKGGVGKTTLAVNLSAALSLRTRVLLIDLDSQGSASLSLMPEAGGDVTLMDVLCEGIDIRRAIRKTAAPDLDLLSSSLGMIEGMKRLSSLPDANHRLRKMLAPVRDTYGFVFIDCPPTFTVFSHNALLASDAYVIPLLPHHLAIEGMGNLFRTLKRLQDPEHPFPPLLGIVLSMVDYRDPSTFERVKHLRKHFRDRMMLSEIPFHIEAAEAPESGKTIFDYAHDPRIAESYWALSKEVWHRSRMLAQRSGLVTNPDRAA